MERNTDNLCTELCGVTETSASIVVGHSHRYFVCCDNKFKYLHKFHTSQGQPGDIHSQLPVWSLSDSYSLANVHRDKCH